MANISSAQTYRYTPLEDAQSAIRLLRIFPAPMSYSIRCSLFSTTLDAAPSYVALSYTWGRASQSKPIMIDGEALFVSPNLSNALRQLRAKAGKELVLWVDAICINQEDVPERSKQTAIMRSIYYQATSAAVWLGSSSDGSKNALQLAHDLNACVSVDEVSRTLRSPHRKKDLDAMVRLFRRQYWWRIWVIQEVISAKSAMIHCGDNSISWDDLDRVCDILQGEAGFLNSLYYKFPSYVRTLTVGGPRSLQLSRYSPSASTPPLLELLISHKSKKSTDPRDKVYALVAISNSRYTFGTTDYSRSVRDVYIYTAYHIISSTQKLDVICVKQHELKTFDLPSWVPDWTRAPARGGPPIVGLHHHQPEYAAAGSNVAEVEFLNHDSSILTANGVIIDKIDCVGSYLKKLGPPADVGPNLEVFKQWWEMFLETHGNSLTDQARFGRAISCGNWEFAELETYKLMLDAIFALADSVESDPPNLEASSRMESMASSLMSSSTASMDLPTDVDSIANQDNFLSENDHVGDVNKSERTTFSAILSAGLTMNRRKFFVAKSGRIGLATQTAAVGDLVCVLLGCRFPVVLHPQDDVYTLVGEAYVEEFMNGEAIAGLKQGFYSLHKFTIV